MLNKDKVLSTPHRLGIISQSLFLRVEMSAPLFNWLSTSFSKPLRSPASAQKRCIGGYFCIAFLLQKHLISCRGYLLREQRQIKNFPLYQLLYAVFCSFVFSQSIPLFSARPAILELVLIKKRIKNII